MPRRLFKLAYIFAEILKFHGPYDLLIKSFFKIKFENMRYHPSFIVFFFLNVKTHVLFRVPFIIIGKSNSCTKVCKMPSAPTKDKKRNQRKLSKIKESFQDFKS